MYLSYVLILNMVCCFLINSELCIFYTIFSFFLFILNFYKFIRQFNAHLYILLLSKNWVIMFLVNLKTRYIMNLRLCFDAILSGYLEIEDEISLEK